MKALLLLVVLLTAPALSQVCPSRCSSTTCSSVYNCNNCSIGTIKIDSGLCAPCPPNCLNCDTTAVCSSCVSNSYYLTASGTCLPCNANCVACSGSATNCTSCPPGQSVVAPGNSCQRASNCDIQNCLTCSSTNVCSTCAPSFFLFENKCNACPPASTTCSIDIDSTIVNQIIPQISNLNVTTSNIASKSLTSKSNLIRAFSIFKVAQPSGPISIFNSYLNDTNSSDAAFTSNCAGGFSTNGTCLGWTYEIKDDSVVDSSSVYTTFAGSPTTLEDSEIDRLALGYTRNTFVVPGGCITNFLLLNNICERCDFTCKECSGAKAICTACYERFYLSGTSCLPCVGCRTCKNATFCETCFAPQIMTEINTCVVCQQPNCDVCSSANVSRCSSCVSSFAKYPNSTGDCYRCRQTACSHCDPNNTALCYECVAGFQLNANKTCQACPTSCLYCAIISNSTVCFNCEAGFNNVNGICEPCIDKCLTCSPTVANACLRCVDRFFLNANSTCSLCPTNCLTCTSITNCLTAVDGYTVFEGIVQPCSFNCLSCVSITQCVRCRIGTYLNQTAGFCLSCGPFCLRCAGPGQCEACNEGSLLISGFCQPCEQPCLTCVDNTTKCTSCVRGITVSNFNCTVSCPDNCKNCISVNGTINCAECEDGYTLKANGRCAKCLTSCSGTCEPTDINRCIRCTRRFELDSNGTCKRCQTGCLRCRNSGCLEPEVGYQIAIIDGIAVAVRNCLYPCEVCSGRTCTKCLDGFALRSGSCTRNFTCTGSTSCAPCPFSTYYDGIGSCFNCPTQCYTCASNTVCVTCVDGYYIDGSTCKSCPAQCITCESPTACKTCTDGYLRRVANEEDLGLCIPCEGFCATCEGEANKCGSCKDGYRLRGNQCIGRYNVGFLLLFDFDYDQFMEDGRSEDIRQGVCKNIFKIDLWKCLLNRIRRGSVEVGGEVSANNEAEAVSQSSALNSALEQDNNVLGIPVSSIQVTANLDDTPLATNNDAGILSGGPLTAAVIIGISFAVFGAIVVVFVSVYYIKSRDNQQGAISQPIYGAETDGKIVIEKI